MLNLKDFTKMVLRAAPAFNAPVTALATSRRFGKLVGRNIAILDYTGRRSGRPLSLPVAYRRKGDALEIAANMPDAKSWWRNFLGDGAPLTVRLDGIERAGHAVAQRDEQGRVTVRVRLSPS
jgi:F420H(2)-dependent quinone reductase